MESVLKNMTAAFPRAWIKTGMNVSRIRLIDAADRQYVDVDTAGGPTYRASHVIVTVSLGVLKSQDALQFQPSLSERKRDAITKAGFGSISKIFLQFPSPFWREMRSAGALHDDEPEGFDFIFTGSDTLFSPNAATTNPEKV